MPISQLSSGPLEVNEAAAAVEAFVLEHRDTVVQCLRESGRSSVARRVAKLPEDALSVRNAAKMDLKVLIEAFALAESSLCVAHLRSGNFIDAVRSADAALIVFGLSLGAPLRRAIDSALCLAKSAHQRKLSPSLKLVEQRSQSSLEPSPYPPCDCAHGSTMELFRDKYFKLHRPVVLKDAAKEWPALRLWNKPSYLDNLCGFRTVPVEISKPSIPGAPREELASMQRVLESMYNDKEGSTQEILYLAQHPIFNYIPELADHIVSPQYIRAGGSTEPELVNVWMGSARSGTKLHFDSSDNFLVQVVGWKRVVLFHPDERRNLHVTPGDNFSPVDVDNCDRSLHPNFEKTSGQSLLLSPGDMLYIPSGWWHWVRAATPSISVNFWF